MSKRKSIAVITGACGGMGLAISRRLGMHHRLAITDVNPEKLAAEAVALKALGYDVAVALAIDLNDRTQVDDFIAQAAAADPIGVMVNPAGLSPSLTSDWKAIMAINLVANEYLTMKVLAVGAKGIVTVAITSIAGSVAPRGDTVLEAVLDSPLAENFWTRIDEQAARLGETFASVGGAYVFSKYGVFRSVKRHAAAYGAKGGRIVCIAPGVTDTPMGRAEAAPGSVSAGIVARSALGRTATADEIAAVVEFVCSQGASFVTGVEWTVDGGMTAAFPTGNLT